MTVRTAPTPAPPVVGTVVPAAAGPAVAAADGGGGSGARGARGRHGILDVVTARVTSQTFVGRETELVALRDALRRARTGTPTTVLIGGEAGVGKSRLIEEFGRSAVADGAQLLVGQCLELGEEGLPFAPFAAALREVLRRSGPAVLDGQEQEFARLLPELGRSAGPAGSPLGADAPNAHRGFLFDLVAELFARLSVDRPLVLVIEDLHWADRSTRDLIAFLVRAARPSRTLLVCTYRTDELHRGHPLRPFVAELDRVRGVERQELARLDRDGTAAILADLVGAEPPARAVDTIHERAQGNPFFVEELAAAGDPAGCATLPDTLRDLLLARVERLPEPAQRVLRIAAAGGTRIAHELLAEVAALPDGELEDALRSAVAVQLVVADPDGGYEFRHALVREAVHDELLPGEHGRLHARYAAAIEANPQLVAAGRAPAELAHHWYAAHDHPRALVAAMDAARAARTRYAYAEQSRLLERVLELWELVPDAAELLGMDHPAVVEEALMATATAGDYARALTLTRSALSEVDATTQPLRAARLLNRSGRLLRVLGKSDGLAQLREAYRLAAAGADDPRRVRLLAEVATQLARTDPAEGTRIAAEAMAAAQRLDTPEALIDAGLAVARTHGRGISADLGMAELRRVEELARAAGDAAGLVRTLVNISDSLFEQGRYAESAQTAADGMTEARRIGVSRSIGAFLVSNRAEALLALGRWDEADAICAEAARLDPIATLGLHWLEIRARLRLARGHDGADGLVGRALAFLNRPHLDPQQRLPLHDLRIEAALAGLDSAGSGTDAGTDCLADAVGATRTALADADVVHHPRYGWPVVAVAARVAALTGDAALSAEVVVVADQLTAVFPAERAYAAQLAATLAGPDEAVDRWRAAVEEWRCDGRPYPLARALVGLAESAAAAGDRPAVAAAVEEAGAIAARLGARPLAEQVATLARRVGVRAAGSPMPGHDLLTTREREVLRLVADGCSNSQIAQQLFISPKTASVHVSRIIAKLDVSNRVEAAAVAHRLGLLHV